MRFSVETWAPEYGIAADGEHLVDTDASVTIDLERTPDVWAPIQPSPQLLTAHPTITFVDGVRRIDARVWIHDGERAHAGVCASVAAGAVTCDSECATVTDVRVVRGLFAAPHPTAGPIVSRHATYEYFPTTSDDPDSVYLSIHEQMTALETSIAATEDVDIAVYDGPLRGRNHPLGVGYIKTQQVQYLPDEVSPVLGQLGEGERTPVFLIGGRGFTRYSWYLRLPCERSHPLSGIVRLELPAIGPAPAAIERADEVSSLLPRFASRPHREPRAPQNLYPIAGLEGQLRRRLGDPLLLERSLRVAAATASAGANTADRQAVNVTHGRGR